MDQESVSKLSPLNFIIDRVQFSDEKNENIYSLSYYSPQFIWLLKDYTIDEYEKNGFLVKPDKFFELEMQKDFG